MLISNLFLLPLIILFRVEVFCHQSCSDCNSNNPGDYKDCSDESCKKEDYGSPGECFSINSKKSGFTKTLEQMKDLFFSEPNPFVRENLKKIFESFAEQKFEISDAMPLSFELRYKIQSLVEAIKQEKGLFSDNSENELECFKSFLTTLILKDNELWNEAEIFLKLPSIMKLKHYDSKKINKMIKGIRSSREIEEFLNDKFEDEVIKKAELEMEVKNVGLKGLNLNTLISQIYKKKPKEKPVFQMINMNLNNLNYFKDKQIYVSTLDSSETYIGKIKDCKLEHVGRLKISAIDYNEKKADIIVNFDSEKIIDLTIVFKTQKILKDKIYSFYKNFKKGDVILSNAYITRNLKFLNEKTNFFNDGEYNIIMGKRFSVYQGHYLLFENVKTGKKEKFEIYDNGVINQKINIQEATIMHENWYSKCYFDEFLRYFQVRSEESLFISFNSEREVNRHFQIKETNNEGNESFELIKKIKEIYEIQTKLIVILKKGEKGNMFDSLIETLLSSPDYAFNDKGVLESMEQQEKGKIILDGINRILNIKKSFGEQTTELKILTDIVKECNYSRLINKEQGINTERIMELLAKGKHITDQLKGKTIIAFFGNTGSGKSTTVNYFAGVPLKKDKNNFGDDIIKIDELEYKGISAKIGHSLGTSETLYAQAFNLIDDTYDDEKISKEEAKDIFLCDNPGFRDTRGNEYEICTDLSIDEAIKNCGNLKAAVLVLPFTVFSLDRANHLIEAIMNFEERFPDLLDRESETFKSVFIAITKFDSEKQIEGFEERLTKHIEEESNNISEFTKHNQNSFTAEIVRKRLEIFKSLFEMNKNGQIMFINVQDNIERQEDFSKIYNSKGIDKSKYNKSMVGSEMIKKFSEEINKTSHTWNKLILDKYLNEIPLELENQKREIDNFVHGIARKKNEIEEIKKSIEKWKKDVKDLNTKLQSYINDSEEYSNLDYDSIELKRIEKIQIEEKLLSAKIKLDQKEKDYDLVVQEISQVESKLQLERLEIENKSKGETEVQLLYHSHVYGQKINVFPHKKGRMEKALEEVSPLKYDEDEKPTIEKAGFFEKTTESSFYIEKKFKLVPENTKFDKDGKLKYLQGGIYKATIKSHLCKLTNINSSLDGKKIVIQYEKYFKHGTDLPYISISHMIPNENINADHIINSNSEINLLNDKISTLQKYKNDIETEKNSLSKDTSNLAKMKNEIENLIERILAAKSKELQMIQIKDEIQIVEKRISDSLEDIGRKEREIKNDEIRLTQERENLRLNEKEHKNFALIIWDQMHKKIPQSLFDFIDIANEINKLSDKDPPMIKEAKKKQKENYEAFKKIFSENKATLNERVSKHLQI